MTKTATKPKEPVVEQPTMWTKYQVVMRFTSPFAASEPKNKDEILAMLEHRMMTEAQYAEAKARGEVLTPVEELAEQVAEEVGATDEKEERGWATFKRDEYGFYYEARCVKAHIKDNANILQGWLGFKALKAKLANRVYVVPAKIYVMGPQGIKQRADGQEVRFVHAMTPQGMRNSIKKIEYVTDAHITFNLKVLADKVITQEILEKILEYGSTHGMGQERSQDWGRYEFEIIPC